MYGISGLLFLLIAQLSHIQNECIQLNIEKKNDFLYNQVSSSMNYKKHWFVQIQCEPGINVKIHNSR